MSMTNCFTNANPSTAPVRPVMQPEPRRHHCPVAHQRMNPLVSDIRRGIVPVAQGENSIIRG